MDLIASHINTDFDSLGSMIAAKKLFPDADAVFTGSLEKKVKDFIEHFAPIQTVKLKEIMHDAIERLIVVDTKSSARLGPLAAITNKSGLKLIIYDHHKHELGDLHGEVEVIEETGATATIMTELLISKKIRPTPIEATALCLGIYEETGCFLYPTTTDRDLEAVRWLLKCGASLNIISNYVKKELSKEELDILNDLSEGMRTIRAGGLNVAIAKASLKNYLGDAAHLAHRILDIEHSDAVLVMLLMEDKILVVGRSRTPELNISDVLSIIGGGGHPTAASATIKEEPLEIVEDRLIASIHEHAKPGKFASDIMTKPVISINHKSTVAEAEGTMTRYGVNVLPIIKLGAYAGYISREAVEKAIYHGFAKSVAIDFAATDAATVERYTPVRDIEAVMIEQNQRFIPVLDGGTITGAITRTDLMRSMYEDYLRKSGVKDVSYEKRRTTGKNIASLLKNRFPSRIYNILKLSGKIADELSYNVYLVGGTVRDILRGEENLDIDFVVEGDGIEFAKRVGKQLEAKVSGHKRFVTATLIKDDIRIDIATARTEYYESPAALPKVEMSSIKKDLYRRDFTINALAIQLNEFAFGKLVDFFGGQRDIKEKTIRVLHNLSFVEDPTRAFRALRFAERFGFKLSKHADNLIKSSLKMNLFDRLSGKRLYEELSLIFSEKEPVPLIERLGDYKLLSVIHPALSYSNRLHDLLTDVHETCLWFELSFTGKDMDFSKLYIMALTSALDNGQKENALKRLSLPLKSINSIVKDYGAARETARKLPFKDPALIYENLSSVSIYSVLFAMALSADMVKKKEISDFLLSYRRVKPALTGADLKKLGIEPGPVYAKLLKALIHENLRGTINTKEDAIRFVRNRIKHQRHQ